MNYRARLTAAITAVALIFGYVAVTTATEAPRARAGEDGGDVPPDMSGGDAVDLPTQAVPGTGLVGFQGLKPFRLVDTRVSGVPVGADSTLGVDALGQGGVPSTGVAAIAVNVTAVGASQASFLALYPAGAQRPTTSTLNIAGAAAASNAATVGLSEAGRFDIYNRFGTTHVIVDVVGWYEADAAYTPIAPQRIGDTRAEGAPLRSGVARTYDPVVAGAVPAGATAVALNVTVTEPDAPSHLTVWPAGTSKPLASNLNYATGQTVANAVTVGLSSGGEFTLSNQFGSAHVIVDVVGWYSAEGYGHLEPLAPYRVADTRAGVGGPTLGPDSSLTVDVAGVPGLDAGRATAVVLNVTAANPSASSFLTVWPAGLTRPLASHVNFTQGAVVPNQVTVALVGQQFSVFNRFGTVDVIVDVVGWYTDQAMLAYDEVLAEDGGELDYAVHSKFNHTNISYRFVGYTDDIPGAVEHDAVRRAFRTWEAVTKLDFAEVTSGAADIEISWWYGDHGDGLAFDDTGGTLAHAGPPNWPNTSVRGKLHFDDSETWSLDAAPGTIDLETVALHEIGHNLGLMHSAVTGAVMYEYYVGVRRYLHFDDIEGIRSLYGTRVTIPAPVEPMRAIMLSKGAPRGAANWYAVEAIGFPANSAITFTCHDSVDAGGFYSIALQTDASGKAATPTLCYSSDGPDHWVTAPGASSNRVAWGANPTTPPTTVAQPPPTTAPPNPTASAAMSAGGPINNGYYYAVSGTGFPAGVSVTIVCRDTVDPGGFYTFTRTTNGSGQFSFSNVCWSADTGNHWVTVSYPGGTVTSNQVYWAYSSPPTTTSPPPAPSWSLTLSRGGAAPFGSWYNLAISGPPGASITVYCNDSVDTAFWTQSFTLNGAGQAGDTTLCYSGDGPAHWVTSSVGATSNTVNW